MANHPKGWDARLPERVVGSVRVIDAVGQAKPSGLRCHVIS
jgi:hypothetical protein